MSSILHTWLNGILTATLEGGVACVTIEQMSTRRRPQVEAPRCFTALSLPRPPSPPPPFCSLNSVSTLYPFIKCQLFLWRNSYVDVDKD